MEEWMEGSEVEGGRNRGRMLACVLVIMWLAEWIGFGEGGQREYKMEDRENFWKPGKRLGGVANQKLMHVSTACPRSTANGQRS